MYLSHVVIRSFTLTKYYVQSNIHSKEPLHLYIILLRKLYFI